MSRPAKARSAEPTLAISPLRPTGSSRLSPAALAPRALLRDRYESAVRELYAPAAAAPGPRGCC